MQREKLYNVHKTVLLMIADFLFKIGANFTDQTSQCCWKTWHPRIPFSLFYFWLSIRIVELLNLHLSSGFVFIYDQILDCKKMNLTKNDKIVYTQSRYRRCKFRPIWEQKIEQVRKWLYATYRAFHAASFVVFCFYSWKNIMQQQVK